MPRLKPIALSLVLALGAATPVAAQSTPELRLPEKMDEALRRMMEDMKPALDEMLKMLGSFEGVDDLRYYQFPEVLENGDIIIRRRPDAPEFHRDPPKDAPETTPEDTPDQDGTTKT